MEYSDFDRKLAELQQRLLEWGPDMGKVSLGPAGESVSKLIEVLTDTREGLRVAEEGLRQQKEGMVEARTDDLTESDRQLNQEISARKDAEEAVRNALEESRRRAAEASALLDGSRAVLEYQEFDRAARAIFDSCKNLIGATAGYVALLSSDGTRNDVVYLDAGERACAVDPNLPMPIRGLRALAYASGKPVYENAFAGSQWTEFLPPGHCRLENVLFAPLLISGHVLGLIGLANKPGGFTDDDTRIAAAFADHAAIAFRNSRYLTAILKSEQRYRRLSESLEEIVRKKVAELQQAETLASIGRMVSTVAHEVRNPLQNIQMGVDIVRQKIGEDDKDKTEILDEIGHGVNSLNRIVKELLEYSKPLSLEYSTCTVREIVRRALNSMAHRLGNINSCIELQNEDREMALDPEKISRVLTNIVSNAVDAMPDGGNLTMQSRFSEEHSIHVLRLTISDSGCGIPQENIQHVSEPFFTTKTWGTGLGISICKRIIEAHKGRLSIESRVHEGTTVEIILPMTPSESGLCA